MTKWKPKNNTKFWYIASDWVVRDLLYWESLDTDYRIVQAGNCFPSREKAEEALNKIKQVFLSEQHDEHNKEKELPKLTADVFDRPDCPTWAKYVATDEDGMVVLFEQRPTISLTGQWWDRRDKYCRLDGRCDYSDWQNSLIERPEKALPDWCKVDGMGWHKRAGYFKITYIDDIDKRVTIQQVDDKAKGYLSFNTVCNEAKHARPRPFNDKEMQTLVGKVFTTVNGDVSIATDFDGYLKMLYIYNEAFTNKQLADSAWLLDGKPCVVYEHKNEKGEWVA